MLVPAGWSGKGVKRGEGGKGRRGRRCKGGGRDGVGKWGEG